ncbi:MAG: response regulator, partial [Desulfobacterales bacterium]|nr:response regulator [Desulfobacterales bacterium]
ARVVGADVLLVEDNRINQRVAAGILGRYGCRVEVVGNGEEAVDRLREKAFDLIFMDAHMPVMDGFEATRKIREREEPGARTPIVAMTALAMAGDRERCLEAGMDDYIAKPIKSKAIFDALLKYCSELQGEDEAAPDEREAIEADAKPVLNPSQLLDIGDSDEELILELIGEFMKDAPVLLDNLREAIDLGDQDRITKKAHKLNGLAANFGGERFLEMGLAIENAAREGVFEPDEKELLLLATELDKLRMALGETDWGRLCGR